MPKCQKNNIDENIPIHEKPVMTDLKLYEPLIFIGSDDFLRGFLSDWFRDVNKEDKKC